MKVYSVAIGNLPKTETEKEVQKLANILNELDGFVAVHPHYPLGNLLLFESKNKAIIGRNELEADGINTGRHICEFEWNKEKNELEFIGDVQ